MLSVPETTVCVATSRWRTWSAARPHRVGVVPDGVQLAGRGQLELRSQRVAGRLRIKMARDGRVVRPQPVGRVAGGVVSTWRSIQKLELLDP